MKKKLNLNFHQTFFPDLEYIAKILEIADKNSYMTKEEISHITGIPTGKSSGKVEPHIDYSKYMNLISYQKENKGYLIRKTKLGKIISLEDPFLQETLTKILCNYFLTSKSYGASMWFQLFRNIPGYLGKKISRKVLQTEINNLYPTIRNVRLAPFNGTYTKDNSLKDINMVKIVDDVYEFVQHKYEPQYLYLYAFTLIEELIGLDDNRKEFSVREIFDILMWNSGFQWSETMTMTVLDNLASKGIIRLNRQLNPVTVIIIKTRSEVLSKLYSLLI